MKQLDFGKICELTKPAPHNDKDARWYLTSGHQRKEPRKRWAGWEAHDFGGDDLGGLYG